MNECTKDCMNELMNLFKDSHSHSLSVLLPLSALVMGVCVCVCVCSTNSTNESRQTVRLICLGRFPDQEGD